MANCKDCGIEYGFLGGTQGRCDACFAKHRLAPLAPKDDPAKQLAEDMAERLAAQSMTVLLTTEAAAADLVIAKRFGIVTAECVFGMHMFKDLFAIGRDIFGGRSASMQNTLKDARNTALDELKLEAAKLGADAVVAVNLDYSEISGGGKSMLFLVASGTAVKLG